MTVKEFAEQKIQELQAAGNKNVSLKSIRPCEIGNRNGMTSVAFSLYGDEKIDDNADIATEHHLNEEGREKAAMIDICFVPPRCRKETVKTFYAAIV